ncbi:hypothetical protein L3X38_025861 [Prunus dulcis]|uniref:Reverse transcriptase/retrotransposon-derived protein RNase H-like domain-containing protein n=1 Tax=Prunus dulcis TaxID=3755 RepID=A0AAD4W4C4_PRUDU|nr:hypothetical protein L3X38_025861 [Prunus dulcis]
MEEGKVRAIQEWEPPTKVPKLRSFLGLVNNYRRFIKGYSPIVALLTNLPKKNKTWQWTPRCQHAFDELKRALLEEPVLRLPDLSKPFEVYTDALDFSIGGVLRYLRAESSMTLSEVYCSREGDDNRSALFADLEPLPTWFSVYGQD